MAGADVDAQLAGLAFSLSILIENMFFLRVLLIIRDRFETLPLLFHILGFYELLFDAWGEYTFSFQGITYNKAPVGGCQV